MGFLIMMAAAFSFSCSQEKEISREHIALAMAKEIAVNKNLVSLQLGCDNKFNQELCGDLSVITSIKNDEALGRLMYDSGYFISTHRIYNIMKAGQFKKTDIKELQRSELERPESDL